MNSNQFIASIIVLLLGLLMWLFTEAYFGERRARNDALFFATAFPGPTGRVTDSETFCPKNPGS